MAFRSRREKKPLEFRLTMRVKFGTEPDDVVTVVDNRKLHIVGSVFRYRDKAINFLVVNLLRAGARRPGGYGRFAPAVTGMIRGFARRAKEAVAS